MIPLRFPPEYGMASPEIRSLIEEGTLEFTLGETESAREKLQQATERDPESFDAWHALSEVCFAQGDLDAALKAATAAVRIEPEDIHIHTSLSRIWMERGDKEEAEKHGAQARMLGWKAQLREEPEGPPRQDPGDAGSFDMSS